MIAIGIDHYNQGLTDAETAMTLKRCQGGDDYPLVLIIYDEETNNTNRKAIL